MPKDWGLLNGKGGSTYLADSLKLLSHMEYTVKQDANAPFLTEVNKNMKRECAEYYADYATSKSGRAPRINDIRSDVSLLSTQFTQYGFQRPISAPVRDKLLASIADIRRDLGSTSN